MKFRFYLTHPRSKTRADEHVVWCSPEMDCELHKAVIAQPKGMLHFQWKLAELIQAVYWHCGCQFRVMAIPDANTEEAIYFRMEQWSSRGYWEKISADRKDVFDFVSELFHRFALAYLYLPRVVPTNVWAYADDDNPNSLVECVQERSEVFH